MYANIRAVLSWLGFPETITDDQIRIAVDQTIIRTTVANFFGFNDKEANPYRSLSNNQYYY